jgi:hypothetical protein
MDCTKNGMLHKVRRIWMLSMLYDISRQMFRMQVKYHWAQFQRLITTNRDSIGSELIWWCLKFQKLLSTSSMITDCILHLKWWCLKLEKLLSTSSMITDCILYLKLKALVSIWSAGCSAQAEKCSHMRIDRQLWIRSCIVWFKSKVTIQSQSPEQRII